MHCRSSLALYPHFFVSRPLLPECVTGPFGPKDLGPLPRGGAETAPTCCWDCYICWINEAKSRQFCSVARTRPRGLQPRCSAIWTLQSKCIRSLVEPLFSSLQRGLGKSSNLSRLVFRPEFVSKDLVFLSTRPLPRSRWGKKVLHVQRDPKAA